VAKRILLLASGSGSLAKAILEAHAAGQIDAEFVALISDKDSPALAVAHHFDISAIFLPLGKDRTAWDQEIFDATEILAPDLIVSVGFMRILSPRYVETFKVINTHPSLLPLFPGAHAVQDALAAHEKITGTTIHWVDAGLDTGLVIAQQKVEIAPEDDESALHERIKIAERTLIVERLVEYGRTGNL